MAEEKSVEIPRVKLGTQGLEVVSYSYISYYNYNYSVIKSHIRKNYN